MKMIKEGNIVYNIGDLGRLRYEYPAKIFKDYGKIKFLGLELDTVADIEKYLEVRYGDWEIPIPNTEYQYWNPIYSPNVKRCE